MWMSRPASSSGWSGGRRRAARDARRPDPGGAVGGRRDRRIEHHVEGVDSARPRRPSGPTPGGVPSGHSVPRRRASSRPGRAT
jgi:hypothetical protein